MTVEKSPSGWIHITYNGIHEQYLYYSVREAKRLFREKHNLKYKRL